VDFEGTVKGRKSKKEVMCQNR